MLEKSATQQACPVGRTVTLVNVDDERDRGSVVMTISPFPGMHLDVPWSDERHEVDYAYWNVATDTLHLGCVPIDRRQR